MFKEGAFTSMSLYRPGQQADSLAAMKAEGAAPNREIGSTKDSFFSQSLRCSALKFIPPLEPFLVCEVLLDTQNIGSINHGGYFEASLHFLTQHSR